MLPCGEHVEQPQDIFTVDLEMHTEPDAHMFEVLLKDDKAILDMESALNTAAMQALF